MCKLCTNLVNNTIWFGIFEVKEWQDYNFSQKNLQDILGNVSKTIII